MAFFDILASYTPELFTELAPEFLGGPALMVGTVLFAGYATVKIGYCIMNRCCRGRQEPFEDGEQSPEPHADLESQASQITLDQFSELQSRFSTVLQKLESTEEHLRQAVSALSLSTHYFVSNQHRNFIRMITVMHDRMETNPELRAQAENTSIPDFRLSSQELALVVTGIPHELQQSSSSSSLTPN